MSVINEEGIARLAIPSVSGLRYRVVLPAALADLDLASLLVEEDDYSLAVRAILPGDQLLLEAGAAPQEGDHPSIKSVEPYIALGIFKGGSPNNN